MDSNTDYSKYTLEELIEVREHINKEAYPERFNEVNRLITEQIIDNKQTGSQPSQSSGCLGFVIGGMSFIPLFGVLFGIIAILWGVKANNSKLKYVGSAGILFTVIIYGSLGYFGFVQKDGVYDELRASMTKTQLTNAVQAIEFYKVQNGHYPETLEKLQQSQPANSMVFLYDAAQVSATGKFYYYQLIDENSYHIRSYGRDGIINTPDDILPEPIDNVGLIAEYQLNRSL
ncbi:type II secretion system protein GspG [Paraferrimonas sp. SM1919]|uniref:type II secretion system protein GspG n=1 Tax=Paraferrimonas sp. SM1919 TaxID=2662263 RepID=UPI0013D3CB01|nr:type II secretion system protein GspG [Paraferrimonas sp. SM1919]